MSHAELSDLPAIAPGLYRHYKGHVYRVIGVARHSETLEPMVIYQPQYEGATLWARPAAMWSEMVTHDGQQLERFAKIGS